MKPQKKKRSHRVTFALSAFLIFALVLQGIPGSAFADPEPPEIPELTPEAISLIEQSEAFDEEQEGRLSGGGIEGNEDSAASDEDQNDAPVVMRPPDVPDPLPEAPGEVAYKDENSITYQTDEREFLTRVLADPVMYVDENGRMQDVDNTIQPEDDGYTNSAAEYDLTLPEESGKVKIAYDDCSVTMKPIFGDLSNAVRKENAIRYNSVAEGIDVQYTAYGNSVKEDIILTRPVDSNIFNYRLSGSAGSKFEEIEGHIEVYKNRSDNEPLFYIFAPVMTDADDHVSTSVRLELKEDGVGYILSVVADDEWLSDPGRSYPVKIDPTYKLNDKNFDFGVIESNHPNQEHLKLPYLYVGYETRLVGVADIQYHNTKSYIKFNYNFRSKLGDDAIVTKADLHAYKYTDENPASGSLVYSELITGKWSGDGTHTWNNQPATEKIEDGADVSGTGDGWRKWDVTDAVIAWATGDDTNRGIMFTPRTSSQRAVCFSALGNEFRDEQLYLDLKWTIPYQVDEDLPLDAPEILLHPLTSNPGGKQVLNGVLSDGIVRPDFDVNYYLSDGSSHVDSGKYEGAEHSKKYPDSSKVTDVSFEKGYEDMHLSNWQSKAFKGFKPKTVYTVHAKAYDPDDDSQSATPEGISDEFIVYKFSQKDLLPRVAKYYGVSMAQVKADNRIADLLAYKGSTVFIRNPKKNKKKLYSKEKNISSKHKPKHLVANLGKGGLSDFDLEPVNTSIGNYYFESEDAKNTEYIGDFSLARSYNSMGDQKYGMFGYGWNFEYDQFITKDDDGNIVYQMGDGKELVFGKNGAGFDSPDGYHMNIKKVTPPPVPPATTSAIESAYYLMNDESARKEYRFNCYGMLESITDVLGLVTRLEYDSDYILQKLTTGNGRVYTFEKNDDDLVTEVTLPNKGILHYTYDDEGYLTKFTNADGEDIRYTYDQDGNMTRMLDGNSNRIVENKFDEYGRVTSQTDALGGISTLDYNDSSTVTINANGDESEYTFDDVYRATGVDKEHGDTSRKYDSNYNLISETDEEGAVTKYEYDSLGNVTKEIRADGAVKMSSYDSKGNLLSETDFNGETSSYAYNARGNIISKSLPGRGTETFTYDIYGRSLTHTDATGGTESWAYDGLDSMTYTDKEGGITRTYYDAMGNTINEIDPIGTSHRKTYSKQGKVLSTLDAEIRSQTIGYDKGGNPTLITDSEGYNTYFSYNAANNLIRVMDAGGYSIRYGYDNLGNMTEETDAYGRTKTFTYDDAGKLLTERNALGGVTRKIYDGAGRLIKEINPAGGETITTYDNATGYQLSQKGESGTEVYTYDKEGNVLTETNQDTGAATSYTYNESGDILSQKNPNGEVVTSYYDLSGNVVKERSSTGKVTQYRYDKMGREVGEIDPLGRLTETVYDAKGRVIEKKYPEGRVSRTEYDALDNVIKETNAEGESTTMTYDSLGNMKSLTDAKGNTSNYVYNSSGNLTTRIDPFGNESHYEYNGNEMLTKEIDRNGYETVYTYNTLAQNVAITDANGHTTRTEYDVSGNVTATTDADGNTVRSQYDAYGNLIKTTDDTGYVQQYEYDPAGQLIREFDNAGNSKTYEYDESGNEIKETDALGRESISEYDLSGNVIREVSEDGDETLTVYDMADRTVQVTDNAGRVTRYEYDESDNKISETDSDGDTSRYEYDKENRLISEVNPLGEKTEYIYDENGSLTETIKADGSTIKSAYDKLDRLISDEDENGNKAYYEYDKEANLIKETDREGNVTEYMYDGAGNLIKTKDPTGAVTETEYTPANRQSVVKYPRGGTETTVYDAQGNALSEKSRSGAVIQYQYEKDGKLRTQTGANGLVTNYEYDKAGRMVSTYDSAGAGSAMEYDDKGNLVRERRSDGTIMLYEYNKLHAMTRATDQNGAMTTYSYYSNGNLAMELSPSGSRSNYSYDALDRQTSEWESLLARKNYTYDKVGNILETKQGDRITSSTYYPTGNIKTETSAERRVQKYEYDKNGNETVFTNAAGKKTRTVYDAAGRQVKQIDAMDGEHSTTYDEEGNTLSEKTPEGRKYQFKYDLASRLTSLTDPGGATAEYTYDAMDNMTLKKDSGGGVTKYEYDLHNNLTKTISPERRIEAWKYDIYSRLTERTAADGGRIRYDYDKIGKLIRQDYSGDTPDVFFGYDNNGNKVSMRDGTGGSNFTYDVRGRLSSATDAKGRTTQYRYDEYGNTSAIIYPDGRRVDYSYNGDDELVEVKDSKGITANYAYDKLGNVQLLRRSDGTETLYTYDDLSRLISLKNRDKNKTLSEFKYIYDRDGKILKEEAEQSGTRSVKDFVYDKNGQLTNVIDKTGEEKITTTYSYDSSGNRLTISDSSKTGKKISKYDKDNRLISTENEKTGKVVAYRYDARGNLISKTGDGKAYTYAYDLENRLNTVHEGGDLLMAACYDGTGNKVFQVTASVYEEDVMPGAEEEKQDEPRGPPEEDTQGAGIENSDFTLSDKLKKEKEREAQERGGNGNHAVYYNGGAAETVAQAPEDIFEDENESTNEGVDEYIPAKEPPKSEPSDEKEKTVDSESHGGYFELGFVSALFGLGSFFNQSLAPCIAQNTEDLLNDKESQQPAAISIEIADASAGLADVPWTEADLYDLYKDPESVETSVIIPAKQEGRKVSYDLTYYLNDTNRSYAETLTEYDKAGNVKADYAYGEGRLSADFAQAGVKYDKQSRGAHTYLYDGTGDVSQSYLQTTGNVVKDIRYDANGLPIAGVDSNEILYGYNGEEYTAVTGLQYLRARYYDPRDGHFLSEDSEQGDERNIVSQNRYAYANNDPVNMDDPSGHSAVGGNFGNTDSDTLSSNSTGSSGASSKITGSEAKSASKVSANKTKTTDGSFMLDMKKQMSAIVKDLQRNVSCEIEAFVGQGRKNLPPKKKEKVVYIPGKIKIGDIELDDETALDIISFIPVIGEAVNGARAINYFKNGDILNGFISLSCAIPLVGKVVKVGAIAIKAGPKVCKAINAVTKISKGYGSKVFRGIKFTRKLNITKYTVKIASWDKANRPPLAYYKRFKGVYNNSKYFDQATGTIHYPSNDGFKTRYVGIIKAGTIISRYGSPKGKFFAPASVPFNMRALPPHYKTSERLYKYRVAKDFPVYLGITKPWFGSLGGGTQYVPRILNEKGKVMNMLDLVGAKLIDPI